MNKRKLTLDETFTLAFENHKKNISLINWNNFELNNQDIFANMYQFWVKKAQKV